MIAVVKDKNRYSGVMRALDLLQPNVAGTVLLKPNVTTSKNAPGAVTEVGFLRAAIDWMRVNTKVDGFIIAEGAGDRRTFEGFEALGYNALAAEDVQLADLDQGEQVEFGIPDPEHTNGLGKYVVSKIALDVDYVVSLALLKTHDQLILSLAMKNMLGVLSGGFDRVLVHGTERRYPPDMSDAELAARSRGLAENVVRVFEMVTPDLCIVDGNGMEGNGPLDGNFKRTDLVIAGFDAPKVDAVCAQIMGYEPRDIPYLRIAQEKGYDPFGEAAVVGENIEIVQTYFEPHQRIKATERYKAVRKESNNTRWTS